ncbi:MAG: beta-galactosidase, partial [Gemmiger sp.]|nr:beta-galactosidase [Gemmiger sp.]
AMGYHFARWAQAGRYARADVVEPLPDGGGVHCHYTLATDTREGVDALWRFTADGRCTLTLTWEGEKAELPEFGVLLPLRPGYRLVSYFGHGPEECMPDRQAGAMLGRWQYDPTAGADVYMVPQEYGARTGVRQAVLTGDGLPALQLGCAGAGMVFSAGPYTPQELENARHAWQLPPPTGLNVRCALGQRGAAGDDSWGALPHPAYRFTVEKGQQFQFYFGK